MPSPIVKSFADRVGKSTQEVEKLWKKAQDIAKKEYPKVKKDTDQYFKIVVGILKNMLNLKEEIVSGDIATFAKKMGKVQRRPLPDLITFKKKKNVKEKIKEYLSKD